jgi:uncharacterized protein
LAPEQHNSNSEVEDTRARTRTGAGLGAYFALTFTMSWLAWWAMVVLRIPAGSVSPGQPMPTPGGLLLFALGGFAPSVAGVVMTWRSGGRVGLRDLWKRCTRFNLGSRPYLVILLAPVLIARVRVAIQLLRGGHLSLPGVLAQPVLLVGFAVQIFLFGPVSEELGWRGFALDRLLARWGGLRSSLVLGAVHAIWHLPLFFVTGTIQQLWGDLASHFSMFALGTLGGAVIFTWLHLATRGSVWAAIMYHLTSNCGISLVWMSFSGGRVDLLVMALASVAVAAGLILADPKKWRQPKRTMTKEHADAVFELS